MNKRLITITLGLIVFFGIVLSGISNIALSKDTLVQAPLKNHASSLIDQHLKPSDQPFDISQSNDCKNKSFSALPHSFTGVSRCNRRDAKESEAQNACRRKANELFPASGFYIEQFYSPKWRASSVVENKCKRRIAGACVDYYRECRATFSRINCSIRVCRKSKW